MTVAYEPGEEIRLRADNTKRAFFVKALNWTAQREVRKKLAEIKGWVLEPGEDAPSEDDQTEAVLALLVEHLVRADPPMEISAESLSDVLDWAQIWTLAGAIEHNMTHEDKKKLD